MRSQLGVWAALALCLVGLAVLVDRLSPSTHLLALVRTWWPLALVALGLGGAVRLLLSAYSTLRGPAALALIGGLLLLVTVDPLPRHLRAYAWPTALIGGGLALLVAFATQGRVHARSDHPVLRWLAVAESRRWILQDRELVQATVTAVASGCVIDLRGAKLGGGEKGRIDVTSVLSGIEVVVPDEWHVHVERYRRRRGEPVERPQHETTPWLDVSALELLGGRVEVVGGRRV